MNSNLWTPLETFPICRWCPLNLTLTPYDFSLRRDDYTTLVFSRVTMIYLPVYPIAKPSLTDWALTRVLCWSKMRLVFHLESKFNLITKTILLSNLWRNSRESVVHKSIPWETPITRTRVVSDLQGDFYRVIHNNYIISISGFHAILSIR